MSLIREIKKSWLIILFGIILLGASFVVLFWNEGRAVRIILSLGEAQNDAVSINAFGADEDNSIYENRIVHFTGSLVVGEPLTEPDYNIHVMAVKLKRRVFMYQWIEETVESNFGGSVSSEENMERSYYYYQDWRDHIIDHRRFNSPIGHKNPDKFPIDSQIQVSDLVKIGKYELGTAVKNKISDFTEITSDTRPDDPDIKMHDGMYYHTNDVYNLEIGDLRLVFSFAGLEGHIYTVVGKLQNNQIVPYETVARKTKVLLVKRGEYGVTEIFKHEQYQERLRTWGFRFLGWVLMFFATTCLSSVLRILLSRIHFLSCFMPHYSTISTNMVFSISMALLITSTAWAFHRPWICFGMVFAAASPFIYCTRGLAEYQRVG